jgi:hypothetical protein
LTEKPVPRRFSPDPSEVFAARLTTRLAADVNRLVAETGHSRNTVLTMLISEGLKSEKLLSVLRRGAHHA